MSISIYQYIDVVSRNIESRKGPIHIFRNKLFHLCLFFTYLNKSGLRLKYSERLYPDLIMIRIFLLLQS
jgi:hypothetical protein